MKWILIAVIVAATAAGEILQASGMRRHGEIHDFRPGAIRRAISVLAQSRFVIGSVFAMAISFFAYMGLLSTSDLSFAVPATAATLVLETVLAKYILKEQVNGVRWAGAALVICGVALISLVIWLAVPALASAAYYLLALIAAVRWRSTPRASVFMPPVSILKPIYGRDPNFYRALVSHVTQDYPEFELIFGAANPNDPALADIDRLRREYPHFPISVHIVATCAPNAKAGILSELARHARHAVLLVNDSDIVVEPGYLRAVTAPLASPDVGLVTCVYRARAESWAARGEALGIATEFVPSVLVARLLGNVEFALGSTMVFRAETLSRIGGFQAVAEYLADDYQLGLRISGLGLRIEFAPIVVETDLGAASFSQVFHHQLRWSRTIRISRPGGYYGYVITHATLWSLVALAVHQPWAAALAFGLRMAAGVLIAASVLRDRASAANFWWIPLRDLFGFAVWSLGAFGHHVIWRDRRLRLRSGGRIDAETC